MAAATTCTEATSVNRSLGKCDDCPSKTNGLIVFFGRRYSRLLYADYSDGAHEPRRSVTRKPLPNARTVVSSLVKTGNKPCKKYTLALMQWSQFLEHDLCRSATAVASEYNLF